MPVKSLSSSVLKWPYVRLVDRAVRRWAAEMVEKRKDIRHIGYFGSYARGDWGVGSDVYLVAVSKKIFLKKEPGGMLVRLLINRAACPARIK
ncbi:nucleotidyltransferase domain-containing protein [Desulfofundulus thermosubterraneus]|uniref:Nucleotidyltransferase domain-containing protein n=1 Tax=Desulfofundulus thermosubterraneus DSM 16057 TaxID=1121432 RepID=A0A1M6DZ83_9FIRM|nr:nucleotidyltransferase domain-containing protein [Desulfofundulus thermosubterraneus]SHI78562.1 Nucleotidyltransferase domain-containing protein [Desulfofundulus thermosubterraneus DSM 16057]